MAGYRRCAGRAAGGAALATVAVAGVMLLAAPVQAVVPGVPAATALDVVAMGDSYTAGVGGSAPLPGADAACRRTSTGYASVVTAAVRQSLATAVDLSLVACSGATTRSTLTGSDTGPGLTGAPRAITGPDQLAAVDADTDLVVLTAGAGDTDFEAILAACLVGGASACAAAGTGGLALYDPATLVQLLAAVDAEAGPRTPQDRLLVRVSGYVQPYDVTGISAGGCTSALSPTASAAASINAGVVALNQAIAGATAQAAVAATNSLIQFVEVDSRFGANRLCSLDPWLVEPTLATVAGRSALHPTDAGHAAYAAAVLTQPVELTPLLAGRLGPVPTATTSTSATTSSVTTPVPTTTATSGATSAATTTSTGATSSPGTTSAGAGTTALAGTVSTRTVASAPVRPTTPAGVATPRAAGALPTTGSTPAPLVVLASILVLGGAAATALTRRRSRAVRGG